MSSKFVSNKNVFSNKFGIFNKSHLLPVLENAAVLFGALERFSDKETADFFASSWRLVTDFFHFWLTFPQ